MQGAKSRAWAARYLGGSGWQVVECAARFFEELNAAS